MPIPLSPVLPPTTDRQCRSGPAGTYDSTYEFQQDHPLDAPTNFNR
jgi:hypothetical protein